jgi:hypothetical protein
MEAAFYPRVVLDRLKKIIILCHDSWNLVQLLAKYSTKESVRFGYTLIMEEKQVMLFYSMYMHYEDVEGMLW